MKKKSLLLLRDVSISFFPDFLGRSLRESLESRSVLYFFFHDLDEIRLLNFRTGARYTWSRGREQQQHHLSAIICKMAASVKGENRLYNSTDSCK